MLRPAHEVCFLVFHFFFLNTFWFRIVSLVSLVTEKYICSFMLVLHSIVSHNGCHHNILMVGKLIS